MAKLFAAPAVSSIRVSTFKGLDVSAPEDQISLYRAADSLNMIPDASGEVRKRPGIQYSEGKDLEGLGSYKKVLEIYPQRLLIAEGSGKNTLEGSACSYSLYRWSGTEWALVAYTVKKPTVVPYGNKLIVFMTNGIFENNEPFDSAGDIPEEQRCAVGIQEGKELHIYTSEVVKQVYGGAAEDWGPDDKYIKTPVCMINCAAEGGGTPHEQINLLNPWVTETFCVTKEAGENTFYLNGEADSENRDGRANGWEKAFYKYFRVRILAPEEGIESFDANGNPVDSPTEGGRDVSSNKLKWFERVPELQNIHDGYRYEFNRLYLYEGGTTKEGKLVGNAAIYKVPNGCNVQPTPVEGKDNVEITYRRRNFREGFASVCHCMCGGVYGVGGYKDRLFIGGSDLDGEKNIVYYSEMDQPLYIGALNYIHSEQGSEILGLNGTAGNLAVLTDRGVALVAGQASEGNAESYVTDSIYTIGTTIPAPRPIGYNNTATFGGEIVYLSEDGVIAIAAKDNYDERYAEHRSALINRKMLADKPKKILNYGRYLLVFCADGYCWLLDENQPSNDGDRPYSSHQYEGFRMDGFGFDVFYIEDGELRMITDKYVHRWAEGNAAEEYADKVMEPDVGGFKEITEKIVAFWETPWIYGSNFYRKKRFSRLALLLGEANLGDYQFKVEGKKNDETEWTTIWDYDGTFCTFDYDRIDYGLFSYRTAHACPDVVRKIKIKKALRFKLRFSNDKINQSFVLREFGLDYVLGG